MTRSLVFLATLGTMLGGVGALSTAQSPSTTASSSHATGVTGRDPEQARALSVPRLDALPALYAEIDAEVRHLYRIGYASNDERRDGQWRTISVRVPSRDAHVRTRAGYYASRQRVSGAQP